MKNQIYLAAALNILGTLSSFGQTCPDPMATNTLSINNVSATILSGGDMHWDLQNSGYEIPKGSGKHSIFASSLWIGGIDAGGQIHMAAQTYRQTGNDFWAGPLDTTNAATNASLAAPYDKVWKLDRMKVEEFSMQWNLGNVQNGTYVPDPDILSWPANGSGSFAANLAPYIDVNGNGIYDPLVGGDFPKMRGDQMTYKIFNDMCSFHGETGGIPLGIEVHATAYSFSLPNAPDSLEVINNTTLYHYEIFNRSTFQIDSTYVGYWQDGDLGDSYDDYVGCNPAGNYGLLFNGDSIDAVYGKRPPILSTVILNGPLADLNDNVDNDNDSIVDEPNEQCLMNNFMTYDNSNSSGSYVGNPSTPGHYYYYLKGPYTFAPPALPTHFMYPVFPYDSTIWTSFGNPADRRSLISSGPFTFDPGQKIEYDFAISWSHDTTIPWGTQAYLERNAADNAQITNWFHNNNFPSGLFLGTEEHLSEQTVSIYPNPATSTIHIIHSSQTQKPRYEILDAVGRVLILSQDTSIDVSGLPAGIYLVRGMDGDVQFSRKFIKQ